MGPERSRTKNSLRYGTGVARKTATRVSKVFGVFKERREGQLTRVVEALLTECEARDPLAVQRIARCDHTIFNGSGPTKIPLVPSSRVARKATSPSLLSEGV